MWIILLQIDQNRRKGGGRGENHLYVMGFFPIDKKADTYGGVRVAVIKSIGHLCERQRWILLAKFR